MISLKESVITSNNNIVTEEQNPNGTTVSSIINLHCPSDDTDVSSKSTVSASGANTSDNTKGITEPCTSNGTSAAIITSTPVRTLRSKSSQVITQAHSSDCIVQLDGPNDPQCNKKDLKLSKQQNKASKSSNSNKFQFNVKKSNNNYSTESKPVSISDHSSKVSNAKKSNTKSSTESKPVSRSAHSSEVSNSKKSKPVSITDLFGKITNLPPITPLPKDTKVVGWTKPKKYKSKPKSQSKSKNKKIDLSTSTSDTPLQSPIIIPIPDKEIKQELILSSQEATAPLINIIQIEPSEKQTSSTLALKSKIKNKKVDLSTELKTPPPIPKKIKTQMKTKSKTNIKKEVTLSSQEAMKPDTLVISAISPKNSEDSIATYQCPLSPCPLYPCPMPPCPATPPPISPPLSPQIFTYQLSTSNPPPSPYVHQLSPPPHTSSPQPIPPSPSINTDNNCSTRRSKRIKANQPKYTDTLSDDEEPSPPELDNSKDKTYCPEPTSPTPSDNPNKSKSKQNSKDPQEPKKPKATLVLKSDFLNLTNCHLIAAQYKTAVYTHKTVENKMQAVQAVLWHNLDHPEATVQQRHTYHQYCTKPCPYIKHISQNKLAADYVRPTKHRDINNKKQTWTGGYFAKIDTIYPRAFIKLLTLFKTLGSEQLMQRCIKNYTQNMNESMHSKLWRTVLKFKAHTIDRYIFACRMLVLVHNFGHERASILYILDMMTQTVFNHLLQKDKDSIRNSKKEHVLAPKGIKKHRLKFVHYDYCEKSMKKLKKHNPPSRPTPAAPKAADQKYESGCEPIIFGKSKSKSKSTAKGCTNTPRTSGSNKASSANMPSTAPKPSTSCDTLYKTFYPQFVPDKSKSNVSNKRSRSSSSNNSSSASKAPKKPK